MCISLSKVFETERPLQMVGAVNAFCALLAKEAGFKALYLSGAGVANISYALPDLGITTLDNVLEDVRRIREAVDLPLLVDIDTGWGSTLMIARTIKLMIAAGAAAVHIEDQAISKRCGHREGKKIVPTEEMVDRIKAAVDARTDDNFLIMARTDALANEGLEKAIKRSIHYRDAGADMLFPEAVQKLSDYTAFKEHVQLPILANITEFGKTPLFPLTDLAKAGVDIALYPLSAARAMNKAAQTVYQGIRQAGTQAPWLDMMLTREELYEILNYENHEKEVSKWLNQQ